MKPTNPLIPFKYSTGTRLLAPANPNLQSGPKQLTMVIVGFLDDKYKLRVTDIDSPEYNTIYRVKNKSVERFYKQI